MYGTVAEDSVTDVFGGEAAIGGSAGLRLGALSAGPQLDVALPWRIYEDSTGTHIQGSPTLMPGARMLWVQPVGAIAVAVRYDARWSPYTYSGTSTFLWHHGIAVGVQKR
jgi:hypothetical protein